MNPSGPINLVGKYNNDIFLSFSSFGVSKLFNCRYDKKYLCNDGITVRFQDERVVFVFPENLNATEKIKAVTDSELGCEFKNRILSCKHFDAILISNELII